MDCRACFILALGLATAGMAHAAGEPTSTGRAAGGAASQEATVLPKTAGLLIGGAGVLGGFVTLVDDGDSGTSTSTSTSTATATATATAAP